MVDYEKLKIYKMGNDFNPRDEISKISDLQNYRYFIKNLELKDGRTVDTIEISAGARYESKKDGHLKHVDNLGLWVNTYYNDEVKGCVGLLEIDKKRNERNFRIKNITTNIYTKINLLDFINNISKYKYNDIEILERGLYK